jgi:four helix bundle protein
MYSGKANEFKKRLYKFTLKLVKFVDNLETKSISSKRIVDRLFRSGTSIMANYVEGSAASSRKEYINFFSISLKSANESKYWLALLRDSGKVSDVDVEWWFLKELDEISKIFGKSIKTLRSKK